MFQICLPQISAAPKICTKVIVEESVQMKDSRTGWKDEHQSKLMKTLLLQQDFLQNPVGIFPSHSVLYWV